MIPRERVVEVALTWVGTPWHRNQMLKGVGADCIGIMAGIAIELGIPIDYRSDYSQYPDGSLTVELEKRLIKTVKPQPGDVLAMSFGAVPHHVAMYCGPEIGIVHAYAQVRKCIVQPYTEIWKRRTIGVYRFPGVE